MRIVVTGVSGLIGSAFATELGIQGHEVIGVSRSPSAGSVGWEEVTATLMNDVAAVVNLAGETIAGRWTSQKKRRITRSRLEAAESVSNAIRDSDRPPSVLIQASASGYYGSRGNEVLDERSSPGSGFLADLCREWEATAETVRTVNTRLVLARFSVVLAAEGGALAPLKTLTSVGLGGPLGRGRQWWSWISLHDTVRSLFHLLETDISGPVNVSSETPVQQRDFSKTLSKVLRRPCLVPTPEIALKAVLGEMGQTLLLDSTRLRPSVLTTSGFKFEEGDLESALRRIFNT